MDRGEDLGERVVIPRMEADTGQERAREVRLRRWQSEELEVRVDRLDAPGVGASESDYDV